MLTWSGYGLRELGGPSVKSELLRPCLVVARPSDKMSGYLIVKGSPLLVLDKFSISISLALRNYLHKVLTLESIRRHNLSSPLLLFVALYWAGKILERQKSDYL